MEPCSSLYIYLHNSSSNTSADFIKASGRKTGEGGRGGGKWGAVGPGAGLGRRGEGRLTC